MRCHEPRRSCGPALKTSAAPALAAVAVSVGRVNAVTRSCLSPGEGDHAPPLRLKTEIKY